MLSRGDRNRGENNYNRGAGFRDNHDGGDREITRGDKHARDEKHPREDKIIRRSDKTDSAVDENAAPVKEQEVRMPKYQPPEKPVSSMKHLWFFL